MPKVSEKRRYINGVSQLVSQAMLWSTPNDWQDFDHFIDDFLLLESMRYTIPRNLVPKSDQWYRDILPNYDDDRFRQFMRVSRKDFGRILFMIQDHSVFYSNNSQKQIPIDKQLAVTLYKLGNDGSSNSIFHVAAVFGIGGGGTVMLIVSRVLKVNMSPLILS